MFREHSSPTFDFSSRDLIFTMAPMMHTAALCLVALCGIQTMRVQGEEIKTDAANDDVYLAINLARFGRLDVRLDQVDKDAGMITQAKTTLEGFLEKDGDDGGCKLKEEDAPDTTVLFFVELGGDSEGETQPDYKPVVQKVLQAGLESIA
ncbi:hypothetical protein Efla_005861 [Eimeria flavescens]